VRWWLERFIHVSMSKLFDLLGCRLFERLPITASHTLLPEYAVRCAILAPASPSDKPALLPTSVMRPWGPPDPGAATDGKSRTSTLTDVPTIGARAMPGSRPMPSEASPQTDEVYP
jgi:hypothetical protein